MEDHHHSRRSEPDRGSGISDDADCQEALDLLYHYLDGELDDERRHDITHHLERCSPCLEAFDFEAELKVVVAQRCREKVPDALRQRVADALAEASRALRPRRGGAGTLET